MNKTYPQAWFALFLLVLLRTAVSVFQYTFSVIPTITSHYFDKSLSIVNWLTNVQCIVYVILSFFTGYIFETLGVKRSILVSGFLCALGSAIRMGQIVGGAASPMALNIMTMFASTWFTENLRATAGVFVASNYGGILVMFIVPTIASDEADMSKVIHLVTGVCVIAFLPLFLMPAKPPTPPNSVQDTERPPFLKGLVMLSKNFHFWVLFFIHAFNVGLSIAFCALFTQIVNPHGYSDAEAGQLNALAIIAGTLGCSVAGPVLDRTKQHTLFLRIIAPMVFLTNVAFVFIIPQGSFASVLFIMTMNQFFLSFLVPVVIELGSETSYPVAESTTNSLLWQGAQVFGFVFVLVMDAMRDISGIPANNMIHALIFQAAASGLIAVLGFIFHGKMARSEAMKWQQSLDQQRAADKNTENQLSLGSYPISSVFESSIKAKTNQQ
ncbi:major facilitator superfamily domain-containing protein [Gilbertella persicaria]|uniref:major facilitator superfamily domain-containing protein n=1 Tax=Gilbertella persicaria TaxID=101096 RepID=UPI00221F2C09|nr:major facilitator superfamily domain-containing protein [Gilbertella persicaria]KAI8069755.1 major facilitator superfamily domain-containing protein [Gilbertella persicaria]